MGPPLTTAAEVAAYVRRVVMVATTERVWCIPVDARRCPISGFPFIVAQGCVDDVEFDALSVFAEPLRSETPGFYLVHNHPNDDPRPTQEDIDGTRVIHTLARVMNITMHDHVIVTGSGYYSFAENRMEATVQGANIPDRTLRV